MSRFMVILICLLLIGNFTQAQNSAQATFDEANTLFENGDLNQALKLYKTIESAGEVSGPLYLNMGITAVQLDSMGLAKYYFFKATDFNRTRTQAKAALEYVNNQFSRQSAMLPKLPWDRAVQWLIEVPSASGVFIIGFFITISGLLLLYLGWFSRLNLEQYTSYIITLIIAGSSFAGLAFYVDYVDQRYDEAVLIVNSQRVTQNPTSESPLISIAYEGYDLTVDQWKSSEQSDWLYVRLGNGQFGWILDEGVKIL
ncbi:MAG: SH3-like domain-containing protein [Balneolaceae bacterium]